MTMYISGPMTGLPNFNRDTFAQVTKQFREEGHDIASPHELTESDQDPSKPWDFYMRGAVKMLMDCDSIAMLPGWTKSKGARREFDLAIDLGMRLFMLYKLPESSGVYANLGEIWYVAEIST